ncbi:chloride channel protein 2-like isoform X2 [Penaeus japonicus]|uniref:chloride channel protein 2-like isoform X2 n=1 Tax=Penaeus japonicus TaxID=27405 RepID=UPI001C714A29|nr:chloride channel protein 2-like isoform X2 [Penaeus japonicus]
MSEERGRGRRWWNWRRRRRHRYRLKDAHSEEDVSLYDADPLPTLQKVTTSDDTLLNPDRIHVHYDDDDDDEDDEAAAAAFAVDQAEAEALWESLVWRDDSVEDEPDTDKFLSESEVENTESEGEGEDAPKDGCNAVQTIVERLRACGIRHGRAVDHDLRRESYTWTSHDLRQFLLHKARLEHGGPYDHIDSEKNESYELTHAKNRRNAAAYRHRHRASPPPPSASPPPPPGPSPGTPRPSGRGARVSAAALLRGHWRPRLTGPRSSVQLEHVGLRDMSPPPPRPRLWSLPAIIVTKSEDPKSPSPPSYRDEFGDAMNYLTVPRAHHTRARSDEEREAAGQAARGKAASHGAPPPAAGVEAEPHSVGAGLASATKLGSIMDLWAGEWDIRDDARSSHDARPFPRGSPPPDPRPQPAPEYLQYEESFMYGRYSANLAEYARQEARRLREDDHHKDEVLFSKELQPYRGRVARTCISFIRPIWDHTFARLGEDWVFLFILGTVMATISFLIDDIIFICFRSRMELHNYMGDIHWGLQLFSWVAIPTLLVIFAAAFCQWMAPSAAGSGIPEMKTILRGVVLKEYLTWKTLLAKIVGLAAVLGAGLPLGKEGPVMHMASIVATMLTKMLRYIKGSIENDARSTDLLAAACTMGVAVCYAAPIGGVLFSIEVTTVYFAVRNYWRGFFAAVVGAMFYRLMSVWFMGAKTIYPLFKVHLDYVYPYDVIELLPFLCIGIVCGFAGSLFVYLHRRYVMFMRSNKMLKNFLKKKRLLYPTFVTIAISIMTFPNCLGQFMATTIPTSQQILQLFSNVTWSVTQTNEILSADQQSILRHWLPDLEGNFHLSLFVFQIVTVIQIAISSTLPVPSGMLIPLFKVGAAFGRQIGEVMASLYPLGIAPGSPIVPGAYAMVGAASFCAAITHTISISVIVFELTGQITYVIPIMIGVLISNCISSLLQPSIYDSMIRIKKLPYLPDIIATGTDVYNIYVEDIMVRDVKYIWYGITYVELKRVLKENRKLKYLPLVDKPESMILLGSIQRIELVRLLIEQISSEKRRKEATRRHLEALRQKWEEEDAAGGPKQSRIRYEDEINEYGDEDQVTTPSLMHRFSRSLSRSFSRSRSGSRSRSRSRSRQGSPSSDSDDSSTSPPGSPASTRSKHDSDSATPPGSPAVNRLKDLFPSKSPLVRKSSRFSVSKVDGALTGEAEGDGKGDSPEDSTGKPAKKRSTFDLLKDTGNKLRSASYRKKENGEKDPVKMLRRRAALKRSNSLDSASFRAVSSEDTTDTKVSKTESPKKGILKRRNSFSLGSVTTPIASPPETPYQTITAGDTKDEEESEVEGGMSSDARDEEETELCLRKISDARLRSAFEKMRMRMESASSMEFKLSQISLFKSKKKDQIMKKPILDLTEEERSVWELMELSKEVDFTKCHIDPAPFQLVERTSLLRVHSMFSMLGINHAYVTAIGRLIGVVALKEVRNAIDGQYVGQTSNPTPQVSSPNTPTSPMRSTLVSGTSPQRLSTFNPISYSDPEAGTLSHRGSRTQLVNFTNGASHS